MAAIKIHDLSEQRDFLDTLCDQSTHFCDDLVDRAAAFGSACPRYDAKGAMHVAALHDRHECRRLFWRERLVADGRLRADFLLHIDNGKARIVHAPMALLLQRLVNIIGDAVKLLSTDDQIKMG